MRILSFDPGKNTGIALIDTESDPMLKSFWTTRSNEELVEWLRDTENKFESYWNSNIDLILIEDYVNRGPGRGGFDHELDKGPTHRVIGIILATAIHLKIKVDYTNSSDKPVNYGWVGMEYKKGKKDMHHWDAITHAYGYCIRKKLGVDKKARLAFKGAKT